MKMMTRESCGKGSFREWALIGIHPYISLFSAMFYFSLSLIAFYGLLNITYYIFLSGRPRKKWWWEKFFSSFLPDLLPIPIIIDPHVLTLLLWWLRTFLQQQKILSCLVMALLSTLFPRKHSSDMSMRISINRKKFERSICRQNIKDGRKTKQLLLSLRVV